MPNIAEVATPNEDSVKADRISEVRRQESLLKTGALQNAILNSANFSSIATDEKGVIQIFNVGAERMLGYAAADVVNRITPADISDPQEVIARATALSVELGTPITPGFEALVFKASRGIEDIYELTYIRQDGSRFPAIVSVTALRDDQNIIIGYLLIGTDNTARQQADDKLRTASQYARSLIEASLDPLVTISPEGKITDVNAGSVKVTGVAREALIGTDFSNYFTEPDMAREGYQQVFAKGFVTDYPLTIRHENGRLTDVLYNASVYKDVQGKVLGVFAAARDITERKKLDQRLRDQQFYTRSLIESNIDALMTTDPAGIISDVNRQMEALTGCTRDELIGAPFKNYFTDPDRAEAGIKRVLNQNKVTNYELTARARDGRETVVSYNATTFYDRDRTLQGVFAAARDITERKLLDQVLQENNVELQNAMSAAEKANLAKSDFLSSMSHELRTPLSAILGFAQLIESGSPKPTPSQKRSVDQILLAGWYLLKLINEILDLALIESGKLSLSLEPVSLGAVMQECEAMIGPQAHKRGISVSFPDIEVPYFVNADRTRLKQVLINLLSNAIKYNGPLGRVALSVKEVPEQRLRISVEDSGNGLQPAQIAQLFQPFNRLGQEANAEEGTGIGLVMTKRLVELMGGVIGVESTVGLGSTFWIELSLTDERRPVVNDLGAAEGERVAALHPDTTQRTLLYVEDNPANLMLVEDLIARRPDIRLLTARDGASGIELAR
ncbi:MAG: PAS domain S-box protein, partial [Burkholderiaceae bacterium]